MSITIASPKLTKALPTPGSPLTQLPVEIRLAIFHYVLQPYDDDDDFSSPPKHHATLTIHPADDHTPRRPCRRFWGSKQMSGLLCLNRLIYSELYDLIYNNAYFVVDMGSTEITPSNPNPSIIISPYVKQLQPDIHRSIRHLDVRVLAYIRGLREDALKMCEDICHTFPSLRSVILRVVHIAFQSNPLPKLLYRMIWPLLETFRGVESIWLHCHETRFFAWGANNRTIIPGASPTGEHASAKFDVIESWSHFGLLPGGAKLYRSSTGKTNPKFDKLLDEDAFERLHYAPRPSVLAYSKIPDRELPGVEIAFRSAQSDRNMETVEARKRRRAVQF